MVNQMNDDLISRKSLIENLNKFALEHYNILVNDLIMKEPIAFDKAKVIERIYNLGELIPSFVMDKIIDIIEKGGLDE